MRKTASIFVLLALGVSTVFAGGPVRVKADHAILRVEPSFQGEVAAQVNEGDILVSRTRNGEWLQVLPPSNLFFWVHSKYVEDGVVKGSRVRVRLGPGVQYLQVHELVKGNTVVSYGEQDGWLKIDPPEGVYLWIHVDLAEDMTTQAPVPKLKVEQKPVEPVETISKPQLPVQEEKPESQVVERPVPPVEPLKEELPPPRYVAKLGLVPLEGQGNPAQYEGYLERIEWPTRGPTSYRLVADLKAATREIVCFAMGNSEQLARLQGNKLSVSGKEYWVKGCKQPIVVLDRIIVRERRVESSRLSERRDRAP